VFSILNNGNVLNDLIEEITLVSKHFFFMNTSQTVSFPTLVLIAAMGLEHQQQTHQVEHEICLSLLDYHKVYLKVFF
jgi:hypothetical protein